MKIEIKNELQISIPDSELFVRVSEEKHPRTLVILGSSTNSHWMLLKDRDMRTGIRVLVISEDAETADTWLKNQGTGWEILHRSNWEV